MLLFWPLPSEKFWGAFKHATCCSLKPLSSMCIPRYMYRIGYQLSAHPVLAMSIETDPMVTYQGSIQTIYPDIYRENEKMENRINMYMYRKIHIKRKVINPDKNGHISRKTTWENDSNGKSRLENQKRLENQEKMNKLNIQKLRKVKIHVY